MTQPSHLFSKGEGCGSWLVAVLIGLLALSAVPAAARMVTDDTGRQVEVPDRIERIYPAGPPATALIYTLVPDKILGWPRKLGGAAKAFLKAPYNDLPALDPLMRDGKVNVEAIKGQKPDVIIDYGSRVPQRIELAKRVEAETGIPYLFFDGRLERTAEIYRRLGPIVDAEARAAELAAAAERFLALNHERMAARQSAGRIRVYYVRLDDGLTTSTNGSSVTDVLRLMGLDNVAGDGGTADEMKVSREQVFAWQPDIVLMPNRDYRKAFDAPEWADLAAVKNHRIYVAPRPPFGWIDEPPSVNRLLGLVWTGKVLYPEAYPEDLRQEARDFYLRFYQVELTDQQLDKLLP